jgi:uncharacterized sporulation protein YeaH/YhbH (DUF444 family)
VSRWHTFFVGGGGWGFSVWVHNAEICDLLEKFRHARSSGDASEAAKAADEIRNKLSKMSTEDLAKARLNDPNVRKALDDILEEKIWDGLRTGKWGPGSHGTAERSLRKHFEDHGREVGANDIDQYLRKAEGFAQNLKGATKSKVAGATQNVTRYKKNGNYIDLDADGNIISFGAQ